jgi:hypothetical protein
MAQVMAERLTDLDVGNIVSLEHVNVTVPDQTLATSFYVTGLGFTRDPYMMTGIENMWINLGEQQFHLPTRSPQVIPGHIGLVVPDLAALEARLEAVQPRLADTQFRWSVERDGIFATCPWGNQFRCFAPSSRFGDIVLGMPYVEFQARPGTAARIASFYEQIMRVPAVVERDGSESTARIGIGCNQWLLFRETDQAIPSYDGHHIAVYVSNFTGPYTDLRDRGLITEDVRNRQFRFQDIVDPNSGERVFVLEHEVRSMHHTMYHRPLVNREPSQSLGGYVRGRDAWSPSA